MSKFVPETDLIMSTTAAAVLPIIDLPALSLLRGEFVFLEFLAEQHREVLRPLAKDERLWEFTKRFIINSEYDRQFDDYFDEAVGLPPIGAQAFVIRRVQDGVVIGMTRLYAVDRKMKKVEIGYTWYIPSVWGKVHNKECKLLLLQYIFDELGFRRAEFRVAHQNLRSQKAVEKIGGVKEGLLRKNMIRNDGSSSDTVIFSIIDDEWPEKKKNLQQLITISSS